MKKYFVFTPPPTIVRDKPLLQTFYSVPVHAICEGDSDKRMAHTSDRNFADLMVELLNQHHEQTQANALVHTLRRAKISEEDIRKLWIPAHLSIPERRPEPDDLPTGEDRC